jgi:hypothetical protein
MPSLAISIGTKAAYAIPKKGEDFSCNCRVPKLAKLTPLAPCNPCITYSSSYSLAVIRLLSRKGSKLLRCSDAFWVLTWLDWWESYDFALRTSTKSFRETHHDRCLATIFHPISGRDIPSAAGSYSAGSNLHPGSHNSR